MVFPVGALSVLVKFATYFSVPTIRVFSTVTSSMLQLVYLPNIEVLVVFLLMTMQR